MQKIRTTFAILLTISLSACQTRPDVLILPQRFISMEIVEIDGKKYVDIEQSFCLERNYKYSVDFLGPTEKFRNVDFMKCDRINGYAPRPYVDLFNLQEDVRQEIQNAGQ